MTPANFTTGDVLTAPERACAAAFVALATLPPEQIEATRREVSAPPLGEVRIAPAGRRDVGISLRGYRRPLGMGRDVFARVDRSAYVIAYAPERPRWHVVRRVLRELVLPALAAHPSPVARTSAAILAELIDAGAVLFATGGEPGPMQRGGARCGST